MNRQRVFVRLFSFGLLLISLSACGEGTSASPDGDTADGDLTDGDSPDPDADCTTDEDCKPGERCVSDSEGSFCEPSPNQDGDGTESEDDEEAEPLPCDDDAACPAGRICADGWCADGRGIRYDLSTPGSRLIYRNDRGSFDLVDAAGGWIVRRATARIALDATNETGRHLDLLNRSERHVSVQSLDDALGSGEQLVITAAAGEGEPELVWTVTAYPSEGFYTLQLTVKNPGQETLRLAKSTPFWVDGRNGGGLFLGYDPAQHRILENGSYTYLDFYADIRTGDEGPSALLSAAVPGNFEGYSVSNSNHCVKDLASDAVWVAGLLTYDQSGAVINLSYDSLLSHDDPQGRHGFSHVAAEAAYQPTPKQIAPGEALDSERYYIHPTETDPFTGLERYADAVKRQMNIRLWTERKEGNRIPAGWNSWTTSGSTGGYGTGITEEIILENLDVMADEFRDWGIEWFQIDDGYEPAYGDWWWREDKFPHGPAWLTEKIREKGLRPGLWIAAFTHHSHSEVLAENPHWFADHSTVGKIFSGGYSILDLTHPEVQEYLHNLFRVFRHEWGFEWLKLDFSYYALFGENFHDPDLTREEAYRTGLRIIREEMGDESFFLAVSALGVHLGLIDANRLTLDNMPVWDKQPQDSDTSRSLQQGFKPTVRTAARRYYLHNHVWINHADLIVFRSNTRDESWPRVTQNETEAFCSYVALTGGIVKMGDKLVDLTAEQINTVRKLLPIYGKSARPLDIFEREFPERWHMTVDSSLDGYDERYDLVGLFNWGGNWDLTQNPYVLVPDSLSEKQKEVPLSGLGLDDGPYLAFEFWTQRFLGRVEGTLTDTIPSHSAHVIALRRPVGHPQFLGWNRQVTMGATDMMGQTWDADNRTLTVTSKVTKASVKAPFTYRLAFYVPDGYAFATASYSGSPVTETTKSVEDKVLTITFTPEENGELTVVLAFQES